MEKLDWSGMSAAALVEALGLGEGSKPQADGVVIRCPWHDDTKPSCSVRDYPDGICVFHST